MNTIWTREDFLADRCTIEMVGKSKAPSVEISDISQGEDSGAPDFEDIDDIEWSDDMYAAELAAYKRNKEEYRVKSPGPFNKLMELNEKRKIEAAARNTNLDALTLKRMGAMTDREMDRAYLDMLAALPVDCRPIWRDAIGLTDEILAEMLAEIE